MSDFKGSCVCEPNDPCDYHLATCISCSPKCKGHPGQTSLRVRYEAAKMVGAFLVSLGTESDACDYCHGVGACPKCWGRAAITRLEQELKRK